VHELGITAEIVALAAAHARGARVRRVVVDIGALTAVLPDAVRFCFDVCAEGTPVEGAQLTINEIPACARCASCRLETVRAHPFGLCPCGAIELEWLTGDELRVRLVEVA
jgi:hydrogenase nickel incorporation protein HypA/HybF